MRLYKKLYHSCETVIKRSPERTLFSVRCKTVENTRTKLQALHIRAQLDNFGYFLQCVRVGFDDQATAVTTQMGIYGIAALVRLYMIDI